MRPKAELIRVVKSPEGTIGLDTKGKLPGRGAYVCPDVNCFKRSRKARAFERMFRTAIPERVLTQLEEDVANTWVTD